MKVTVKTLEQETFQMEMAATDSVKALKERIEGEKGPMFKAEEQKLIYAGKVLVDEDLLSKYGIDEKKFVVVMPDKSKMLARVVAACATASAPTPAPDASAAEAFPPPAVVDAATEFETSGAENSDSEEFTAMVENILALGYSRPQVEDALKASDNNPDRAVEHLLIKQEGEKESGLPAGRPGQGAQVASKDRESMDRLKALGFTEQLVEQAFFACEKNENLAANFLLNNDFDV